MRERVIPPHQNAEPVPDGKRQCLILGSVNRPVHQSEINESLIQLLRHKLRISAGNVIANVGAAFFHALCRAGKIPDDIRLARADVNVARNGGIRHLYLAFGLLHQRENFLRPLAKDHSLVGEQHLAGPLRSPNQQLLAQFLFQRLELDGKGGLGKMQRLRRR